jgi:acyl transferase domain-containing protein
VAGVIKMVLAMQHGVLPESLHIDEPSPHVDWSSGAVRLLNEATGWPQDERPRRVGVSSFGISGTNVHVILEQGDSAADTATGPDDRIVPWVLSSRTDTALRGQAEALLRQAGAAPLDTAWSLVAGRSTLERRAVVVGAGAGELRAGLRAVAGRGPGRLRRRP